MKIIMSKKSRIIIIFGLVLIITAGIAFFIGGNIFTTGSIEPGSQKITVTYDKPATIGEFYDKAYAYLLSRDPEKLTALGDLRKYGIESMNYAITDMSDKYSKETYQVLRKCLDDLKGFSRDGQTEQELLTTDIMQWYLEDIIEGEKFKYYENPANLYEGGVLEVINTMAEVQRINNLQDAKDFIYRLAQFDKKIDQLIDFLKIREEKGITMPQTTIEYIINKLDLFSALSPKDNALYINFSDQLAKVKEVDVNDKQKMFKTVEKRIEDDILPACKKLKKYLTGIRGNSTNKEGLVNIPGGIDYYEYLLKYYTTLDLSPKEIHERALKRVEDLKREFLNLAIKVQEEKLKTLYKKDGMSPGAIQVVTNFEGEIRYTRGVTVRSEDILDAYKLAISEAKSNMENLFNIIPQNRIKTEWLSNSKKRIFEDYYEPAAVDSRESAVLNISKPEIWIEEGRIKSLVSHEVYPGHHLQISVQRNQDGVPLFRKICSFDGFNEGWANYSETLVSEMLEDDTTRLLYIQTQLFEAALAVIDTGINYKGWNSSQALGYLNANTNKGSISDVERCIELPGKSCAGFVGGQKMMELREKAKSELKNKFNIKDYNEFIIKNGSMPLPLLEKQVENFIRLNK